LRTVSDNTTGFPFGRNVSECSADAAGGSSLHVDKCFTTSNNAVYVIYLHWPEVKGASPHTAKVSLDHLVPSASTTVSLLGDPQTAITHSTADGRFEFEVPDTCDPLRPFFAAIYGAKCLRVRACVYDVARRRPCVVSWISATRSSSRLRGDAKRLCVMFCEYNRQQ